MLNLETIQTLKPIAQKIIDGLKDRKTVPGLFAFSFFLATVLNEKDFELLEVLEKESGAAYANDWLCDVMVLSGRYDRDGDHVFVVSQLGVHS